MKKASAQTLCVLGILWAALFVFVREARAANCQSAGSGDWNALSTWASCDGGIPGADDSVEISNGHVITLSANPAPGILSISIGGELQIMGEVTVASPISISSGGRIIGGNLSNHLIFGGSSFTNNGTVSGKVTFAQGTILLAGSGVWQPGDLGSNTVSCSLSIVDITGSSTSVYLNSDVHFNRCDILVTFNSILDTGNYSLDFQGASEYTPGSGYGITNDQDNIFGNGPVTTFGHVRISQGGYFFAPLSISSSSTTQATGTEPFSNEILVNGTLIGGIDSTGSLQLAGATVTNNGTIAGNVAFVAGSGNSLAGSGVWQPATLGSSTVSCSLSIINIIGSSTSVYLNSDVHFNRCDILVTFNSILDTRNYSFNFAGASEYTPGSGYGITNDQGNIVGNGPITTFGHVRISQDGYFLAPLSISNGSIVQAATASTEAFSNEILVNGTLIGGIDSTGSLQLGGATVTNNGTIAGNVAFVTGPNNSISGSGVWQPATLGSSTVSCSLSIIDIIGYSTYVNLGSDVHFERCDIFVMFNGALDTRNYSLNFAGASEYTPGSGYGITNDQGNILGNGPITTFGHVRISQGGYFFAPLSISSSSTQVAGTEPFSNEILVNGTLIGGIDSTGSMQLGGATVTNNGTVAGNVAFVAGSGNSLAGSGVWQPADLGSNTVGCSLTITNSATVNLGSDVHFYHCDILVQNGSQLNAGSHSFDFGGGEVYIPDGGYSIINQGIISGTGQVSTFNQVYINQAGTFSLPLYIASGTTQTAPGSFYNMESATGTTLEMRGDMNINGNWVQRGALTHNNYALTFSGAGNHPLSVFTPTDFYRLIVNDGVTVVETETANNASIASGGGIITYGSGRLRKTLGISTGGDYTFGLTGVQIHVDSISGTSPSIQVDRLENNHPNARTSIETGRYWSLTPLNASNYQVDLALPHQYPADAGQTKACRYIENQQTWDCAQSSATTTMVIRADLTALSEWAVGYRVDPTSITLQRIAAHTTLSQTLLSLPTMALLFVLILTASTWLLWNQNYPRKDRVQNR